MAPAAIDITVEPWQEGVIRRLASIRRTSTGPLTCREIGIACGRSESWARAAVRLLDVPTARMQVYRRRA